jgi:hypothetical protein
MKALTVLHNGNRVCIAGGDEFTVLAVSVTVVRIPSLSDTPLLGLTVGGVNAQSQPISWPAPQLASGDEVTIRLTEVDLTDPPQVFSPGAEGSG